MPIEIRAIEPDEVEAFIVADTRGFGQEPMLPTMSRSWARAELDRTRVAFEDGEIIGGGRAYSFELTLPGGALVPAAALSWVSVLPTHRRRGVLTRLIEAMHADARERGEPVAILTASESAIYGRYGYGIATWRLGLSVERARAVFAQPDSDPGRMRLVAREEAEKVLPGVYERVRLERAGMVSRPDYWWPTVFWGLGEGNDKAFFTVLHEDAGGVADGFAAYEITGEWDRGISARKLYVWDIQSPDPAVRASLWRYLLGVDLVATVSGGNLPLDEPLRHLLTDSRRVRVDYVNDGLWLAPLDARALLEARRYDCEDRVCDRGARAER